jgi:hypothetical protein
MFPPTSDTSVDQVIERYKELFENNLGCYNGPPAELKVEKEPRFHKARSMPYAIQPRVEKALEKMKKMGIIERVSVAKCAAPIVPVPKKNSEDVRICGDFSVTYNPCAAVVTYPIPRIEDLHAALRGCTLFSIIDMSQAFNQIPISQDSQQYLTINTHIGLFVFKRMPFGIHSGPAIFQQVMDTTLAGLPGVICYLDDILVGGVDKEDHLRNLSLVFERLLAAGFRLNQGKCTFEQSSVTYLAHVINAEGLHPTADKLQAISDAPHPEDVTQLKSFLGLIMFYARFLPFHAKVLAPLNNLQKKDVAWRWTKVENDAFVAAKKLLLGSQTLVHYDENRQLYLSCDASSYGAGAVLSHRIDGENRPIAFASCTLSQAQRNYSQLDKEAFSIIFGLKRFHQFLYGRSFCIITDHKPLLQLLGPDSPVPVQAAARLQRWALILSAYKYTLEYRSTHRHADADSMSRLPLAQPWDPQSENMDCFFFESDTASNVTHELIKKNTSVDPVLSKVFRFTMTGWPSVVDPSLVPYKTRKDELSVELGCVLWGSRVIVPSSLQEMVLKELHETHPGITKMKMLARSYVWWPKMDSMIEETVSACHICQAMRSEPATAQVHPWTFPTSAWSRLHIDFAGPVGGHTYLVLVDAYSKYPEVVKMSGTTTTSTLNVLRDIFSRQGLPEVLVSDNGPQFSSQEFAEFCAQNGIIHRTSAVHKPSSNGQAERVVQILKSAIKQAGLDKTNVDSKIAKYMLIYRVTPHSTTGESPSMLLMGRRLRTRLDLLVPSVRSHVEKGQDYIMSRTAHRGCREFSPGDRVQVRNYGLGDKWRQGVVNERLGKMHYRIDVGGPIWKRHVDQMISCSLDFKLESEPVVKTHYNLPPVHPSVPTPMAPPIQNPPVLDKITETESMTIHNPVVSPKATARVENNVSSGERRYPSRENRKAPSYLKDFTRK